MQYSRLSRGPFTWFVVKNKWITGMISGVRDGEGFAKDVVCFFTTGAREPLNVVEQGRFVNTVLREHCAGWPGGGMAKLWGQKLLGMLNHWN